MSTDDRTEQEEKELIRKGLDYLQNFTDDDGKINVTKLRLAYEEAREKVGELQNKLQASLEREIDANASLQAYRFAVFGTGDVGGESVGTMCSKMMEQANQLAAAVAELELAAIHAEHVAHRLDEAMAECDAVKSELESKNKSIDKLVAELCDREICLGQLKRAARHVLSDTILKDQSAEYYMRIMSIWRSWLQAAIDAARK